MPYQDVVTKPWDLEMNTSGPTARAVVMLALVSTRSHFTDSFMLNPKFGRSVSLFLRVHIPVGREQEVRTIIGRSGELKESPKVQLN